MSQFQEAWDNGEGGFGDAEVIPAGEYQIDCVKAEVGSNGRIWTLWSVLTGPEAGSTFFGSSYGLTSKDPKKERTVQGMFKNAMIGFGIPEAFFKTATRLEEFAEAICGVQGTGKVKVRTYKNRDGIDTQSNELGKFVLSKRVLPLPSVGGIPADTYPAVVTEAQPAQVQPQPVLAPLPDAQPTAQPVVVESQPVDRAAELRAELARLEAAPQQPVQVQPQLSAVPDPVITVDHPSF